MDPDFLRQQAENYMKNMSPDQLKDLKDRYNRMSPEEKQKIVDMAKNMGLGWYFWRIFLGFNFQNNDFFREGWFFLYFGVWLKWKKPIS